MATRKGEFLEPDYGTADTSQYVENWDQPSLEPSQTTASVHLSYLKNFFDLDTSVSKTLTDFVACSRSLRISCVVVEEQYFQLVRKFLTIQTTRKPIFTVGYGYPPLSFSYFPSTLAYTPFSTHFSINKTPPCHAYLVLISESSGSLVS
jgi:hypothetical protein